MSEISENYLKIMGLKFDVLEGLSIVTDANRKTLIEAAEFAQKHDDNDTLWLIVPCTLKLNKR